MSHHKHFPQIGDYTAGFYPYDYYVDTKYQDIRDSGAMDYYMDDPDFFRGGLEIRLQELIRNPVTAVARDFVIQWIDNYFRQHNLPYKEEDWIEDFRQKMNEIDLPFWAAVGLQGFYTLDDLLYNNGLRIIRRTGNEGRESANKQGNTNKSTTDSRSRQDTDQRRSIADNSNNTLANTKTGERITNSETTKPSHSVNVDSQFPPNQLNIQGTVDSGLSDTSGTLNDGTAPTTNWNYANSMSEAWASGGMSQSKSLQTSDTADTMGKNFTLSVGDPTIDRQQNKGAGISNGFLNSLGFEIANNKMNEKRIDMKKSNLIAQELPVLLRLITENLPFEMLKRELGKMFIQIW